MKEVYSVHNAGAVGFISPVDRRGFEISPEAWTSMNSVRMDEGGVVPAWGYSDNELALDDSAHSLDYMANRDLDENYYIIASDELIEASYINPADGSELLKKTLGSGFVGNYDTGDVWVTTNKDGHQVMTNGRDAPQMILREDIANLEAVPLSGFTDAPTIPDNPTYARCRTIIAFNGFLVAGHIGFQGIEPAAPNMIAWSDRSDNGTIPASWDYTDPATLAGNSRLSGNYGGIVAFQLMRDELMVYCERGAYRMQYVGGQYVFRIVPAFDTVGALSPRSVCGSKGRNVIVSNTDIMVSDGQYPVSISSGKVRNELFDQISPSNAHKVQVLEYPRKSEIIIICPGAQDDEWCGKVLAWNWKTETWSIRRGLLMRCMTTLPNLVSSIDPNNPTASSTYDDIYRAGIEDTTGLEVPPPEEVYNDTTNTIESQPTDNLVDNYSVSDATYGTQLADAGVLYLFGIATKPDAFFPSEPIDNASNSLWKYDSILLQYRNNPEVWKAPCVERTGINLGNDESIQMVTAVYPRLDGEGVVDIQIGAIDSIGGPDSTVRWDPPVRFDPQNDYRITCRVVGRRHGIKVAAVSEVDENGVPTEIYGNFRLTGYDMEFSHVGRR